MAKVKSLNIDIDSFIKEPKSDLRSEVLDHSVKVEFMINVLLSLVVGLNPESSLTLGIGSTSLSFFSKVNLLKDYGLLDNKFENEKLKNFSEIRNQFAHLWIVKSIDQCKEENLKFLKKTYTTKSLERISYKSMYEMLFSDVIALIRRLIENLSRKSDFFLDDRYKAAIFDALINNIEALSESDKDLYNNLLSILEKSRSDIKVIKLSDFFGKKPLV